MKYIITGLLFFVSCLAHAQAGYLDKTFGDGGVVTIKFSDQQHMYLYDLKVLPDGKIIHCGLVSAGLGGGDLNVYVMRLHNDGRIDSSFGHQGYSLITSPSSSTVLSIYPYTDGRILVYGDNWDGYTTLMRPFAVRFLEDGTIDSTFGSNGKYIPKASINAGKFFAIKEQTDGSIIALGSQDIQDFKTSMYVPVITRITSDGRTDISFGDSGTTVVGSISDTGEYITAIFRDDSHCIFSYSLLSGNSALDLVSTDLNGKVDTSLWHNGRISRHISDGSEYIKKMIFTPDGKLLCTDRYLKNNGRPVSALLCFGRDGDLDYSFGEFGVAAIPNDGNDREAFEIAIDSNRNIIQGGRMFLGNDKIFPIIMHYHSDGKIDSSHGGNGTIQELGPYMQILAAFAVQTDGKFIAAGTGHEYTDYRNVAVVSRINSDGKSGISLAKENSSMIVVHPTPSTNNCTVTYTLPSSGNCTLTLRDESGREVKTFTTNEYRTSGEHKEELDLRGLPTGAYFLQLESNGVIQTAKLIKE
jgi:uncharacterized delta-60 repeat protein